VLLVPLKKNPENNFHLILNDEDISQLNEHKGTFLKEGKIEIIDCYSVVDTPVIKKCISNSDEMIKKMTIQDSYDPNNLLFLPQEIRLLSPSRLINHDEFVQIAEALPQRFRDYNWKLVYSTYTNGTSLVTFFSKTENQGPTIILIGDQEGYVFGGFVSEEWKITTEYFGDGESFVFSVRPKFAAYYWTKANDYYATANRDFIAMGGGNNGRFAFYLDSELNWGTSEVSKTFLNRTLSRNVEFYCTVAEVWAFTLDEVAPHITSSC